MHGALIVLHFYPRFVFLCCHISPHCLINEKIFRKKNLIEHEMCVFSFSTTSSETFPILIRIQRLLSYMCPVLHVSYPLFLSDFMTLVFSLQILEE